METTTHVREIEYMLNSITLNYVIDYLFRIQSKVQVNEPRIMAQPADGLTLETAHKKLKTQITEIEGFIQRHTTVGSLGSEQRAEAGVLQRKLEHRLSYLKILWYAEPDEVKFEELTD
jgi:hypothetical protein